MQAKLILALQPRSSSPLSPSVPTTTSPVPLNLNQPKCQLLQSSTRDVIKRIENLKPVDDILTAFDSIAADL